MRFPEASARVVLPRFMLGSTAQKIVKQDPVRTAGRPDDDRRSRRFTGPVKRRLPVQSYRAYLVCVPATAVERRRLALQCWAHAGEDRYCCPVARMTAGLRMLFAEGSRLM